MNRPNPYEEEARKRGKLANLEAGKIHQQEQMTLWGIGQPHRAGSLTIKETMQWRMPTGPYQPPRKLFDDFWHEGEFCVLFADHSMGKSILATQIADAICCGTPIVYGANEQEEKYQPVVYLDMKLTAAQFSERYPPDLRPGKMHHFHHTLQRAELVRTWWLPEEFNTYEEFLLRSIPIAMEQARSKILIIDNFSRLRIATDRWTGKPITLLKHLRDLRDRNDLSILLLAHTTGRAIKGPIDLTHLEFSKAIMNTCDSVFAMGRGADAKTRYLKQLRSPNADLTYNEDNTLQCSLIQKQGCPHFEFTGLAPERRQQNPINLERQKMIERLRHHRHQGKTERQLAAMFGLSTGAVHKYLKEAL